MLRWTDIGRGETNIVVFSRLGRSRGDLVALTYVGGSAIVVALATFVFEAPDFRLGPIVLHARFQTTAITITATTGW